MSLGRIDIISQFLAIEFKRIALIIFNSLLLLGCLEGGDEAKHEAVTNTQPLMDLPYMASCQPSSSDWIGKKARAYGRTLDFYLVTENLPEVYVKAGIVDLSVRRTNAGPVNFAKFDVMQKNVEAGYKRPVEYEFLGESDLNLNVHSHASWFAVDFEKYVLLKGYYWDFKKNTLPIERLWIPDLQPEIKGYLILPDIQIASKFYFSEYKTPWSAKVSSLVREQIRIYVEECGYYDG